MKIWKGEHSYRKLKIFGTTYLLYRKLSVRLLVLFLPRRNELTEYKIVHDSILVCPSSFNCLFQNLNCSSSSIAWFPMLFYTTIYIGDLYKRSSPPATTDQQQTIIDEEATRLGSRALFYASLLSLIASLVLPVFVAEAAEHPSQNKHSSSWSRISSCRLPRVMQVHLVTLWAASQLVFAGCMFATLCVKSMLQFKLHSLLDASFTVLLTAYGGPLSSSLLRDFRLPLVHGLHSLW